MLRGAELRWAWQPRRLDSPTHTAAGEALTSTVRSVSTEPKPCQEKLIIFIHHLFFALFHPHWHTFFRRPVFTLVTHITCVRRVECWWQIGQLMCVCSGNTTDTRPERVAEGGQARAVTHSHGSYRFNTSWLTLLLWLRQLDWQACSPLSFFSVAQQRLQSKPSSVLQVPSCCLISFKAWSMVLYIPGWTGVTVEQLVNS